MALTPNSTMAVAQVVNILSIVHGPQRGSSPQADHYIKTTRDAFA